MNKYFPSFSKTEYRPDAGPDDTLVFRHYNPQENVYGRPMEEWMKFSVSFFNAFRYMGDEGFYGDKTHLFPFEDRQQHQQQQQHHQQSFDKYKRRIVAAFEFFHKLGVKYYSVCDRDLAPEGDTFDETSSYLDEAITLTLDLQKQTGIRPLYYTCDLFTHPRYMNGASTNPDAHVFAYTCAQVKKGLETAKRLGAENFLFFNPRDGYNDLLQRQQHRDLSHLAQFYRMAASYRDKIGYKGQLLIQPKPFGQKNQHYEADANATMHLLRNFGLEKHYKLNIKPAFSSMIGRSYDSDVNLAASYNMLGGVEVSEGGANYGSNSYYYPCGDGGVVPFDVRAATHVVKCVLEMGGLGQGGFTLGARMRRESVEMNDLFECYVLAMDTFARALRSAARMISEGVFARSLHQRYSSYKSGMGERVDKGVTTFEECEEYIRKNGDPQIRTERFEHYNNMFNYYVYQPYKQ